MGASPTPRMMDAAFRALGLDAVYRSLSTGPAELSTVLTQLKESGVSGFNVTMPHKTSILKMLESLDETASTVRAVNTVKREGASYRGYNTDVGGIVRPLTSRGLHRIRNAVVLGTGGAARAFVAAMNALGCRSITAMSRKPATASDFLSSMSAAFPNIDLEVVSVEDQPSHGFDLFFNASPRGSNAIPLPPRLSRILDTKPTVFDAVYSPVETELIGRAKAHGCQVIYGHEMLLHQGAEAVRIWTGNPPPLPSMKEALMASLEVLAW
ncbi:MAG: shikimate dehydrogenase [Nitrososphaerota archaeon]|nr:shikimate dehydrogenase [Nitrososphaerota archaeon]MDG7019699.1 shikimate dehydrogenase [Nitrososphaerota archaeon]MDG7027105.1 shikimate dehydrogenase [Nitrososphaerota archaeon]